MRSIKIAYFPWPPSLCPSTSKCFPQPWPWTSNFKRTPPLQQTMEQQPHRACEQTNSKQKQNQSRHIQIYHAFYCSIQPRNNAMVSLKDDFTVWHQSQ